MTRTLLPTLAAATVPLLLGCANSPGPGAGAGGAPPAARAVAAEPVRGERSGEEAMHPRVPPENVRDVMQAKLAHAHALLEGLAMEDFEQVEMNARELEALSELAGWRVHTTVAYGVLSDEFGAIAAELAGDARRRDVPAATRSYVRLTESCIACHTFLRREGLYRDVPGAVSRAAERAGGPR